MPSFVVSAAAPFAWALVMERFGEDAAVHLSLGVAVAVLAAAVALQRRFGRGRA